LSTVSAADTASESRPVVLGAGILLSDYC